MDRFCCLCSEYTGGEGSWPVDVLEAGGKAAICEMTGVPKHTVVLALPYRIPWV